MKQRHLLIALLAGVGIAIVLRQLGVRSEPASAIWYRLFADSGVNPNLAMGGLFGLAALVGLIQTLVTIRKGFVYCGPFERVYRNDSPRRYRFWRLVQFGFVAVMTLVAVVFAAGIFPPP